MQFLACLHVNLWCPHAILHTLFWSILHVVLLICRSPRPKEGYCTWRLPWRHMECQYLSQSPQIVLQGNAATIRTPRGTPKLVPAFLFWPHVLHCGLTFEPHTQSYKPLGTSKTFTHGDVHFQWAWVTRDQKKNTQVHARCWMSWQEGPGALNWHASTVP